MENQIICILNPFLFKQKVMVFENSNQIYSEQVETSKLPETIMNLVNMYNVEKIGLHGPARYVEKTKEKINELNLSKYSKTIEISKL